MEDKYGDTVEDKQPLQSHNNLKGSLVRLKASEVPEGALWLRPALVAKYHRHIIKMWRPESEVKWLKYGSALNVVVSNLTGLAILLHFRRKFNLGTHGYLTSVAATLMAPAVITITASKYIEDSVLLGPSCPTCLEVRAGVLQVLASFAYQALICPVTCIYLSRRYSTYLTPKINFKPNLIYAMKCRSTVVYSSFFLIACNFAAGYFTPYKQGEEMDNVVMKEAILKGKAYLEHFLE